MSRNFTVLGKAPVERSKDALTPSDLPEAQPSAQVGEYKDLVRRLFQDSAVVAVIGAGPSDDGAGVCEGIAAEFSGLGRRVVLVSVNRLLPMDLITLPDETAFMPGLARNVWLWPSPVGQQIEFFKPRASPGAENWLDALRRNFDSVVLDCPPVEVAPLGLAIAARADAAALIIEASRTTKSQIVRDQRALQLSGVKLVGCILLKPR